MARSPSNATLTEIWGRINKIAQGAALMTETTLEVRNVGSDANIIGNDALAPVAQKNLEEVGGYTLSAQEKIFALDLQKTCRRKARSRSTSPSRSSHSSPTTPTSPPPRPT